jgi:integrase
MGHNFEPQQGEALKATWSQFDFSPDGLIWPISDTKKRKPTVIPLNDEAIAVLERFAQPSATTRPIRSPVTRPARVPTIRKKF